MKEFYPLLENSSLYQMREWQHAGTMPLNIMAQACKEIHTSPLNPLAYTEYGKSMAAACELVQRATQRYHKPVFGLKETKVGNKIVAVNDQVVLDKAFCELRYFKREESYDHPQMLIVAPMSGHHATLLRGTVQALLPFYEVYITDWKNAREVPTSEGEFGFDDYLTYIIEFLEHIGPGVHTIAVCQPSVQLFAATALMNAKKHKCTPKSIILMGGPIDTRVNPTQVNQLATEKPISWFEQNVITRVPFNYPGFMRRVYPGFLQLTGFMTMNLKRHIGEHISLFWHLVKGDGESAQSHKKFYNEYLSVADLDAKFYLETIEHVFQKHALPEGTLMVKGENIDPGKITKTAILCIEGELDDISGVGQTKAAIDLCTTLPETMKKYHLQKNVGHYGIFNGRRYREHIVPVIRDFIKKHDK